MITANTRKAYSEVDAFLGILDDNYKNKIPEKIRKILKNEKDPNYTKNINPDSIENEEFMNESLSIIAFLNLQYWCEDEEEKAKLTQIYQENGKKYTEDMYAKLSNLNSRQSSYDVEKPSENLDKEVAIYHKESFFQKIINKIKRFFRK